MNQDKTELEKRIYELESIALHRDVNDKGYDFMDIIDECLEPEEKEEYDFLIKSLQIWFEQSQKKKIWKEIDELEQIAIEAYREHHEWGIFLEALCDSDLEAYTTLMSLYEKVNHETYWRK